MEVDLPIFFRRYLFINYALWKSVWKSVVFVVY